MHFLPHFDIVNSQNTGWIMILIISLCIPYAFDSPAQSQRSILSDSYEYHVFRKLCRNKCHKHSRRKASGYSGDHVWNCAVVNIFWCISCLFWHADEWPESRGSSIFAGFLGPLRFRERYEAFQSSSVYSKIIQEYWVTPYLPNAVQLKNVAYTQSLDPIPNYLILSESKYVSLS